MKRMLVNAAHTDELRVAITEDSILIDLDIENPGLEQKKSNIYKGRITSIEPSLGAVFVDYGSERHGFLPLKEVSSEYFLTAINSETLTDVDIKKVLKEGQEIVVQIDKEERGTKGAALTTFITLAGCYLVLMPNNPKSGGISRRIEGDDREQLREIIDGLLVPEGMGIIIRTAGVGRSKEELGWDLKVLLQYWEAIKQAAVAKPGPYLIHQESDVIIRTIRDNLRQDTGEIVIDDVNAFRRVKEYITQIRPDFIEQVKLYTDRLPIFSRFQVERQIEAAYQREVRLPSGGSIVIDHSEALVAIDINSARATRGSNIEETALLTNLEAADEIAKQLRIRDIGGLVVIDFIDMTPVRHQREVENRLRNALRLDRARIQLGRISRFGLLEMSRQRLRSSLSVSTQMTCPRCEGRGTIRSVESLALSIIHLIQETSSRTANANIQIQLPIDITTYLINEKRDVLREIEVQSSAKITLIPNQHLKSPHFLLKTTKEDIVKLTPSYKLIKTPKTEAPTNKPISSAHVSEPAVQQYLSNDQIPIPKKPQTNGLIKRLWDIMFGGDATTQAHTFKKNHNVSKHSSSLPKEKESFKSSFEKTRAPDRQRTKNHRPYRDDQPRHHERKHKKPMKTEKIKSAQISIPEKMEKAEKKESQISVTHPDSTPITTPTPMPAQKPKAVETETTSRTDTLPNSAPTQSAAIYQNDYKGLLSDKPLQQVTTKKT